MYKYRDYFPRSVLNKCGVSPDKPLADTLQARFFGKDRLGEIQKSMSEVYSVFARAAKERGNLPEKWLQEARIGERIISAFFDMDVLQERDREAVNGFRFAEPGKEEARTAAVEREERVAIEVPETEEKEMDLSPKADGAAVAQRGKTL